MKCSRNWKKNCSNGKGTACGFDQLVIMETKEHLLFQRQQAALMNNYKELARITKIARMNNIDIGIDE